jgi:hypothetical protein
MNVDGCQISGEIHCFNLLFRKDVSRVDDGGSNCIRRLGDVVQEGPVSHNLGQYSVQVDSEVKHCRLLKKSYRRFGITYFIHLHDRTAKTGSHYA